MIEDIEAARARERAEKIQQLQAAFKRQKIRNVGNDPDNSSQFEIMQIIGSKTQRRIIISENGTEVIVTVYDEISRTGRRVNGSGSSEPRTMRVSDGIVTKGIADNAILTAAYVGTGFADILTPSLTISADNIEGYQRMHAALQAFVPQVSNPVRQPRQ